MSDPTDDAALLERAWHEVRTHGALRAVLETARAVAARAQDAPALRARALHVLGHAQSRLRRPGRAIRTLREAAALYGELGDAVHRANVYDTLGQVYATHGRLEEALHNYSLSLVDKAVAGDRAGLAVTIGNLGRLHLRAGRFQDAIQCFERDLAMSRELGDVRGEARMFEDLGRAWAGLEQEEKAETAFRAAATLAEAHDLTELVFYARLDLALLYVRTGRVADAEAALAAACATHLDRETPFFAMLAQAVRGEVWLARGDPRAVEVLEQALARLTKSGLPDVEIPVRLRLAKAFTARGEPALAERILVDGVRSARRAGFRRYLPALNEAMTALRVVEGAVEESGRRRRPRDEVPDGKPADGAYLTMAYLGKGAYGEVYRAWDPVRGREVALKLVHLERVYDNRVRARLLDSVRVELKAASRVHHPGVARVYAVGEEDDGGFYVVQDLIPGHALRRRMQAEEDSALEPVLVLLAQLAYALAALHAAGVVHRDLKPENVIVRPDGTPVLVDFGIAHLELSDAPHPVPAGTLEYMAPEQASGETVDGRADLYALGVIAFEWLVGFRPLQLTNKAARTWREILTERKPPRVSEFRPDVPKALDDLIARLLAKKPRQRPSDAAEVADALKSLAADPEVTGRSEGP